MSPSRGLLSHKLLFVTGKGGVGKTSVASALGFLAARSGLRTLVCEVDAKGDLSKFFGIGPIKFDPTEVRENLFAMSMDTEASLNEYLRINLKLPLLTRIGPLARTFDFLANAAPGVKEILTVGKLTYEVREQHYDLVVVDAAATGHVVGQLSSPVAINDLVKVGLVRSQTDWMIEILTNADTTGVVVVTAPEEMPVTETLELVSRLGNETDVSVAAVVVNRVLPELFARGDEELFEQLLTAGPLDALTLRVGDGLGDVLAGAELAVNLRRGRVQHLTRLRDSLPSDLQMMYLPYLFNRSHGVRATAQLADALSEEMGVA
ncbi:MAG: ArsA family ATPase [Microthrixaceae bacterium]